MSRITLRRPRHGALVAFFVCGLVDEQEREALWQDGTLFIDETLLDRATVVEALGETYYVKSLGLSVPCYIDTDEPRILISTLVLAFDVVHDARLAFAEEPDTWKRWTAALE